MSTFHFKQFSVQNEKSAMKVNTDSVLLGAWAEIPKKAKSALDIGSGTGVLALMLAQKNINLNIEAIEIEKNAFEESEVNFSNSPYFKRLKAVNLPLQEFTPNQPIDLIISNPPYFINDLKNRDNNKSQARHTASLTFLELIEFAKSNLSDKGVFSVILPKKESEIFLSLCTDKELHLTKIAFIKPNPSKVVNRVMMSFGHEKVVVKQQEFCVYKSQGVYSQEHKKLTKDFYLDK